MSAAAEKLLKNCMNEIGSDNVLSSDAAASRYGPSTSPLPRRIAGAVLPANTAGVAAVVKIAAALRVPLYPLSTGRNWGYGSALPATDDCVIVDLSSMNTIVDFDQELGVVTLEPGVTQQMLYDYITSKDLPFLVPTTGAGPTCGLLGNALDRGYGGAPVPDHFSAVNGLEAVLADGSIYRSPLSDCGGHFSALIYKWGAGPYLDGLFTQGNFGIVTKMTIALAHKRPGHETFFLKVAEDTPFETLISKARRCLRELAPVFVTALIMNPERIRQSSSAKSTGSEWMFVGTLSGSKKIVQAAKGALWKIVKPVSAEFKCYDVERIDRLHAMVHRLPLRVSSARKAEVNAAREVVRLMAGIPSTIGLNVAYSGGREAAGPELDPARDGCGLLWYAPLVPFTPEHLLRMKDIVERECAKFGFSASITLNILNERCVDYTIPLIFDAADSKATEAAYGCYRALLSSGREAGYLPYRFGVFAFDQIVDPGIPFWNAAAKLKSALDPYDIIAPGRYSLTARE